MVVSKRAARVVVGIVAALCIAASGPQLRSLIDLRQEHADLPVYYTAASLVQDHRAEDIYEGADTGVDPQLRWADERSICAAEARVRGIRRVGLYVYPPLLAYLAVPLAWFSFPAAETVWKICNWFALLATAAWLIRLLGLRRWGPGGLSCRTLPVRLSSVAGVPLLRTDRDPAYASRSSRHFPLRSRIEGIGRATLRDCRAIKLTPAIVIVPLDSLAATGRLSELSH